MFYKKRNNFLILIFTLVLLLTSFNSFSYAETSDISVYIDSKEIKFDSPPILKDGRILVPMRKIFEELGSELIWDKETRSVSSKRDDIYMKLTIGSKTININGKNIEMDTAPFLYKSKTFVPLRIISETYGLQVNWINLSKEVRIITNPIYIENSNRKLNLGMTIRELKNVMGQPTRVDMGKLNARWYSYNNKPSNYKDFLLVKVRDNRVIGFQTNSKNWILSDLVQIGDEYKKNTLENNFFKKHTSKDYDLDIYEYKLDGKINAFSLIEKESLEYSHLNIVSIFNTLREEEYSENELRGIEKQIFDLTNVYRINHNLEPLLWNSNISSFARNHSLEMYKDNYFSHDSIDQSFSERIQVLLIKNKWRACSENIAFGFLDSISMMNGWFNSKSHRENLLDPAWKYHGVGVVSDKNNQLYGTQNFTY